MELIRNFTIAAIVCLGCSLQFVIGQALAPNFQYIPITVDGIITARVTDICQDEGGYLWMTSAVGLLRYDGYDFKLYSHNPKDSTSLPTNIVEVIHIDRRGALWVGTGKGAARYSQHCDCFIQYSARSLAPHGFVVNIAEGADSTIWFAVQEGGLYSYRYGSDEFVRHLHHAGNETIVNDMVRVLLADKEGMIWVGTGFGKKENGSGLLRYNPNTREVRRFLSDSSNPGSLIDNRISALLEDDQGRILIGTYQNGLHFFDKNREEFIRLNNKHNDYGIFPPEMDHIVWEAEPFVNVLHQDKNGAYWIGTIDRGIYYFGADMPDPILYSAQTNTKSGLLTNLIWTIFEDQTGIIWLADLDGYGLHKFDPSIPTIEKIVAPDRQRFIATPISSGNSSKIHIASHSAQYAEFDLNTHLWSPPKLIIEDLDIKEVLSDNEGNAWLGGIVREMENSQTTGYAILIKVPASGGVERSFKVPVASGSIPQDLSMCQDNKGIFWIALGEGGFFRFDPTGESFDRIRTQPSQENPGIMSAVFHTDKGKIWVYDRQKNTTYHYDHTLSRFRKVLVGYDVTSVADIDSAIWFGTARGSVIHFRDTPSNTYDTIGNIIPRVSINEIFVDASKEIWLGSSRGLYSYDKLTETFNHIGLHDHVFHKNGFQINGRCFFNTDKGLIHFDPKTARGNLDPPRLHMEELYVQGERVEMQKKNGKLVFDHDQNNFTFSYTGIHFSDPLQNKYKYRLSPFDKEWIEGDDDRSVRYTNIPPGAYSFELMGSNSNGVWTKEPLALGFIIQKPWWMRWWAICSMILAAVFISIFLYYVIINRKIRQLQKSRLEEINELKTKLYTNLTHELRTPLTVIMGLADNLRNQLKGQSRDHERTTAMIYNNGEQLLHLVNKMLDFAKLEDDSLNLDITYADIIPLVKNTVKDFHPLAKEKDIILQLNDELGHLEMEFDSQKLSIIISNLLSNAIKFTPFYGIVKVRLYKLEKEQNFFCISVIDNGVGIPVQEIHRIFDRYYQADNHRLQKVNGTGIGLSLCKEITELMDGRIEAQQGDEGGMVFTVKIPIHHHVESEKEQQKLTTPIFVSPISRKEQNSSLPIVLLIEDNLDVSHYIQTCLADKFHFLHAPNGETGLQMAFEELPDILITDVMMPGIQGFEVVEKLREDPRTDHIPLIILTARIDLEDRLKGLKLGADAYLTKPFNREELLIRVENLLEVRKSLQRKYSQQLLHDKQSDQNRSKEDHFIIKAEKIILDNIQNQDFSGTELASAMYLSRSQLFRKIKALTGMSTSIFIRHVRLCQALKLLRFEEKTVSEVAYAVGFKSPVYFTQVFKEKFHESPSAMRESISQIP